MNLLELPHALDFSQLDLTMCRISLSRIMASYIQPNQGVKGDSLTTILEKAQRATQPMDDIEIEDDDDNYDEDCICARQDKKKKKRRTMT